MVAGVEISVEAESSTPAASASALEIRTLGPLRVSRGGVLSALPASRKVRGLIAYLALASRPQTRAHLCELLGDIPNDPRAELRWCLSKARAVLDAPGQRTIATQGDTVRLELAGSFVDAIEIEAAMRSGIATLGAERLHALCLLFAGDFLDGLEIERSPHFNGWLLGQRRRFRACHIAVLEHLVDTLGVESEATVGHLETWLRLAPYDRRAHEVFLRALARLGRIDEAEAHLAATARTFEAEGLDWKPLGESWSDARAQLATHPSGSGVDVATGATPDPAFQAAVGLPGSAPRRASIAVMPFADRMAARTDRGGLADGLAHDIITRLAKLRNLFVIAQGTVFALDERRIGAEEAGRTLSVDYVVSGLLRRHADRISVIVELAETRTARIVWAESFDRKLDDAFLVLEEIGNAIVALVASEIETLERNRAILKPPNSLDAWEAHHRGLWHMYRFNQADNQRARHFFEMAVRLDPSFARAYAGLSFTHFQGAFQQWAPRQPEIDRAFATAGQSLVVDDRDPAAHWAMGRALWLRGEQEQSLVELETAVHLSPNFALGHYTLAFVHSQSGDPQAAIGSADHARHLSPFDPLLFGMLGSRAMALVRLGRFEEAADWAVKAAARPNAHAHILAIAAECLALAGRPGEARAFVATIRKSLPRYGVDEFLAAFRFSPDLEERFREGARRIGFG